MREHLPAIMVHYERVWRSRTPSKDVTDVLAINRVTFTDLLREFPQLEAGDRVWLAPAIKKVLFRLRREFPDERWDGIHQLTRFESHPTKEGTP